MGEWALVCLPMATNRAQSESKEASKAGRMLQLLTAADNLVRVALPEQVVLPERVALLGQAALPEPEALAGRLDPLELHLEASVLPERQVEDR